MKFLLYIVMMFACQINSAELITENDNSKVSVLKKYMPVVRVAAGVGLFAAGWYACSFVKKNAGVVKTDVNNVKMEDTCNGSDTCISIFEDRVRITYNDKEVDHIIYVDNIRAVNEFVINEEIRDELYDIFAKKIFDDADMLFEEKDDKIFCAWYTEKVCSLWLMVLEDGKVIECLAKPEYSALKTWVNIQRQLMISYYEMAGFDYKKFINEKTKEFNEEHEKIEELNEEENEMSDREQVSLSPVRHGRRSSSRR